MKKTVSDGPACVIFQIHMHGSTCVSGVCVCVCSLGGQDHLLARAGLFGLAVLPRQVLPHRLTGELGLAGVAKVPRQVQSLAWAPENTEGARRKGDP